MFGELLILLRRRRRRRRWESAGERLMPSKRPTATEEEAFGGEKPRNLPAIQIVLNSARYYVLSQVRCSTYSCYSFLRTLANYSPR